MNKKKIIIGSIIIILIILLTIVSTLYISKLLNEKEDNVNNIYGTVYEVGNDYIKIKSLDGYSYKFKNNNNLGVGDLINVYKENDEFKFDVIAKSDEVKEIEEQTKPTTITEELTTNPTTTTTNITSGTTTSKKNTTTNISISTTKYTSTTTTTKLITITTTAKKEEVITDSDIIEYAATTYESANANTSKTISESIKEKFITIVDFIFYDGEIKGKKFSDLSATAKGKVIYYALLIDNKIDNKWPDYKTTISDKYNDLKAKLIAKYLDITTSICKTNETECANLKSDFNLLKYSVNLTWDVIKSAFSYAYNKGVTYLKDWYEVFSGK